MVVKKILIDIKPPIFFRFIVILLILIAINLVAMAFYDYRLSSIVFIVKGGFLFILFNYLFFSQFELTQFQLHEDAVHIKYPVSLMISTKRYKLIDIRSVKFNFNPGPYGSPYLKIETSQGISGKIYCYREGVMMPLIDSLKSLGIPVIHN